MNMDKILTDLQKRHPITKNSIPSIREFGFKLIETFDKNGKLFIAGNGGSMADAQHIGGELIKSFEYKRNLSSVQKELFHQVEGGPDIAAQLENGVPVYVLGLNHSLTTAILNDFEKPHLEFAQELWVLGTEGDMLLGISTKGRAKNVINAMKVAKAKGMFITAFTGKTHTEMHEIADLSIHVPDTLTSNIQELQQIIYHTFSRIIESHYFSANK